MRRVAIVLVLCALLLVVGHGPAGAREIRQGDQCEVGANEVIKGNLFVICRALQIKGQVDGDVIGAATDATITGTVNGDLYMAAGQLDIAGTINGSIHFGGPVLRILSNARITGANADLMSLSLSTTVENGVKIPGNVTAAGYQLVMEGGIDGEVDFWGSALKVDSAIGRDVNATVGDPQSSGISQLQTLIVPFGWDIELENPGLVIGDDGSVAGDLKYSGPSEGVIDGNVDGQTVFTPVVTQPDLTQIITNEDRDGLRLIASQALREFIVLALIGIVGLVLVPRQFLMPVRTMQSRTLPSVGVGLLAFIISFPVTIVVLILIIFLVVVPLLLLQLDGLFVALLSGAFIGAWGGTTSIFYFTTVFISRAVTCLMVGRVIVQLILGDDGSQRVTFISLVVGVALLSILVSLPTIGILVSAISAFWGLGAILIVLQTQLRAYRDRVSAPVARFISPRSPHTTTVRPLPPPMLDDGSYPPGMENLPEGFEWWDD
ncbi:MAG: polymer-forming cytoskeletal protein [Anaerolineae bacterium]